MSLILEHKGFEVVPVASVTVALRFITTGKFDTLNPGVESLDRCRYLTGALNKLDLGLRIPSSIYERPQTIWRPLKGNFRSAGSSAFGWLGFAGRVVWIWREIHKRYFVYHLRHSSMKSGGAANCSTAPRRNWHMKGEELHQFLHVSSFA